MELGRKRVIRSKLACHAEVVVQCHEPARDQERHDPPGGPDFRSVDQQHSQYPSQSAFTLHPSPSTDHSHLGGRFSANAARPSAAASVVRAVALTAAPAESSVPKCSPIVSLS